MGNLPINGNLPIEAKVIPNIGYCNNAGVCDSTIGKCICHTGRNGEDCSSKYQIKRFLGNNRHY